MKYLIDAYFNLDLSDRLLVEKTLTSLINDRNYYQYKEVIFFIERKYGIKFMTIDLENISHDVEKFLLYKFNNECNRFNKQIFSEPLLIELFNNEQLYHKYAEPLIGMNQEDCFKQIISIDLNILTGLVNRAYKNYYNEYYIRLVIYYLKKVVNYDYHSKLPLDVLEMFAHFFINLESSNLNIKIDYKIISMTEYFKQLLKKEKKKLILQGIKQYKNTSAYHTKISNGHSSVTLNISHFRTNYYDKSTNLKNFLETIFHECRHAYQYNTKDPIKNCNVRERVIVVFDDEFYSENHDYFEVEIDAELYALYRSNDISKRYFRYTKIDQNKANEERIKMLTNRYAKKESINTRIDQLLLQHYKIIGSEEELMKEYYLDGYPKGIIDILRARQQITDFRDTIIYNDIIIRCLNRMTKMELMDKIYYLKEVYPLGLIYIEEALQYQLNDINLIENMINTELNNQTLSMSKALKYQNKYINYANMLKEYYSILNMVKENRVAKK